MPKSAEQMNQERRAAKAKQRAASNARRVAGAQNAGFSMQDAQKDRRNFEYFRQQLAANLKQSAQSACEQIARDGAMKIEVGDLPSGSIKSWQEYCFAIITHIRDNQLPFVYNRDWKEAKEFLVGKPK